MHQKRYDFILFYDNVAKLSRCAICILATPASISHSAFTLNLHTYIIHNLKIKPGQVNRRFDDIYRSEPIFTDPYFDFQIKDTNARTHREMYRTHKSTHDKCMKKLQSSFEKYVLNGEY